MSPLALDPRFADEFAADPAADYEQQSRYLDRCRRVRVGPAVTLVFENRRTLAFRVRELEQFARRTHPQAVSRELDWYARLLPARGELLATLQVRQPGCRPSDGLNALAAAVAGGAITFRVGDWEVTGLVREDVAGDRVTGPAYWVRFGFPADAAATLADPREPAVVAVDADIYAWESNPLGPDVRRSLVEDLSSGQWAVGSGQ